MRRYIITIFITATLSSLITAAVLVGGLGLAAGCFLIDLALRRGTPTDPLAPPAVFRSVIEGNGRAIRPAARPRFPGEEWAMTSFDGLSLFATHFSPATAKSHDWVVVIHGYGLTQAHGWHYASRYLAKGYHALTPDMRASGASGGRYITMGALEGRDIAHWTQRITEYDPEARIVLHGVSMGAAAAMVAAASPELSPGVAAVVEDSGYSDIGDLFTAEMEKLTSLPARPLVSLARLICPGRAGFDFDEASPVKSLTSVNIPVLFIHSRDDQLVPFWMMDDLYAASSAAQSSTFVVEGFPHSSAYQAPGYYETVFSFVGRKD